MKINALTILFGTSLFFYSCEDKPELVSGIIKENMNLAAIPGNNFEEYVNGTWLSKNKIPADKSSYGVFDQLFDKSQKDVKDIIEEAAKQNSAFGTDQQKIGDFYASYMDMKKRNNVGVKPLSPWFNKIDKIQTYAELASFFGEANKMGFNTPFAFFVTEDMKDPTKYVVSSWQSGLGLPEREYYLNNDKSSQEILKKYTLHIEKMFLLSKVPKASEYAQTILNLEKQIASIQMTKEDTREALILYNKFEISKLKTLMPDFDWNNYFRSAGFKNLKTVIISQTEYTKKINTVIKNTSLETWKIYLKWSVVNELSKYLNEDMDKQNFEFFGKVFSGVEKQESMWKRAVEMVNENLGEIVGKVYVKKHFTPEAKQRMEDLVSNLLKAYENSINELDWMSSKTKKEALKKLKKIV